jgi:t-SNARE complex subunit (syntaxin)
LLTEGYNFTVSTMKEIQAALPKLSREEIEEIREWIDDYLEDQLELADEVKAKLEQSRREIAAGRSML